MKLKSASLALDPPHLSPAALRERLSTSAARMSVVVADDPDSLEEHLQAWEGLAAEALEPNPFYEAWVLLPALRSLAGSKDVRVVLIFAAERGEQILCGVFPLEKTARFKKLPVSNYRLWQHLYCGLCTPLVRSGYGRECLDAFLDWLATERDCTLMEFNLVSGAGPFQQLLYDRLLERNVPSLTCESFTRAMFTPMETADAYVRTVLSRQHRKDLRRRTRRLSELGRVEFDSLEPHGDISKWIEEYLELEAGGWKSATGGAFACNDADRGYFAAIARAAFERNRLTMLALRLDGKAIAMKCNFDSAPGSFAFRIAFDENYSFYSPGVMLEIENIRRLHEDSKIKWMDSCAIPGHQMIERLWLDRRPIQSTLIPAGGRTSKFVLSALPFIRSARRTVRRWRRRTSLRLPHPAS